MSCGDQDYAIGAGSFADVNALEDDKGFLNGNIVASDILSSGLVAPSGNPEWVHIVPPVETTHECISTVHVNGKEYLLVDNSGPEEMDPIKLQAQIVELRISLYEAIGLIPGPVAEGSMYGACGGYIGLPDLTFSGYSASPGSTIPEFNFGDISLVAEPTLKECKLVSQEEANYERAMNMIGK